MSVYYAEKIEDYNGDYNPFWEDYTGTNNGSWLDDFLIVPTRDSRGKINDLYTLATGGVAEEALEAIEDFSQFSDYCKNLTQFLNESFEPVKPFNKRQVHRVKELLPRIIYNADADATAELMTLISGEEWKTYSLIGYCQGDYMTAIYKPAEWTEKALDEVNTMYWGGGNAYTLYIDGEVLYTTYCTEWNEEEITKFLALEMGCKPEEVIFSEEEAENALYIQNYLSLEAENGTPA